MERINAYTSKSECGGVSIDVEGMVVDLVTVMKASGNSKEYFLGFVSDIFDKVEISVDILDKDMN